MSQKYTPKAEIDKLFHQSSGCPGLLSIMTTGQKRGSHFRKIAYLASYSQITGTAAFRGSFEQAPCPVIRR